MWTQTFVSVISLIYLIKTSNCKIFERCELAKELKGSFDLTNHEVAMFTCIAEKQSSLDTRALGSTWGTQFHGLYQLSDEYWCSSPGTKGYVCGVACDRFRDDDIRDDFTCARYSVYEEHQRISGDGFNAWPSNAYCKANVYEYLSCLNGDTSNYIGSKTLVNHPVVTKASHRHVPQGRSKIYDNCELAQDLVYKHDIPMHQVATWVCIAYHESRYNTSAIGRLNWDGSGDHGLFQISDIYWCGPGKACGLTCDDLHDDDIADDVRCIKQIHAEHTRLSGDGFTAWTVYPRCRGDVSSYIDGCFSGSQNEIVPVQTSRPYVPKPAITAPPKPVYKPKSSSTGKVYTKCELAKELYNKHNILFDQIPTWVCIAKHESSFNTSAVGRLNWDGSEDHGLFQISDIFWCTHGSPGKACDVSCEDLRDDDISDDVRCIKQIHEEHTRLSGDGFTAWTVYPRCRGDVSSYIDGCFSGSENEIIPVQTSRPYVPRPAITAPPKPVYKAKSTTGKVYSKCDLAKELYHKHNIPFDQIPTWVCIAKHESSYNTSAVGRLNWDGSEDHGLFQISDIFWCTHGSPGKACGVSCEDLRDDDISDDVRCIKQIHEEHTRLSGDGFNAWTVYPRCRGDLSSYVDKCFNDEKLPSLSPVKPRPAITGPPRPPQVYQHKPTQNKNFPKGKVYTKCELAQDLYYKHNLPWDQIPTWVCIAKHESAFNTSAIGRLNWDGSEDHGLFQVSDIYWCDHGRPGKACNLACSDLEDGDITDDIQCIKQIHDEHTLISGDGFNAWTVYPRNCKGRSESYVSECFVESTTKNVVQKSTERKTTTTKRPTTTSTTKRITTKVTTRKPTTTVTTKRPTTTITTKRPTTTVTTRRPTTTVTTKRATTTVTTRRPTTTVTTKKPTTTVTTKWPTTTIAIKRPTTTVTTRRPTTTVTTKRPATTATTRRPTTTLTTKRPTTTVTTRRTTTSTTKRPTTSTKLTTRYASVSTRKPDPTIRQNPNRIEVASKTAALVKQNKFEASTKKSLYSFYLTDFEKTSKTLPTFKPFAFQSQSKTDNTPKKPSSFSTQRDITKKTALVQKSYPTPFSISSSTKTSTKTTKTTQNVPFTQQKPLQTNTSFKNVTEGKSPSQRSLSYSNSKSNEIHKSEEKEDKPKNAYEHYVKYVLGGKPLTVAPYSFDYIKGLTKPTLRGFSA